MSSAYRLARVALGLAIAGLIVPIAMTGAVFAIAEWAGELAFTLMGGLLLPVIVVAVGVTFVLGPVAAVAAAVVALVRIRRASSGDAEPEPEPEPEDAAALLSRASVRRTAIIAIVVALLLPGAIGGFGAWQAYSNAQEHHAWDTAFQRNNAELDHAAQAVLADARAGIAQGGGVGWDVALPTQYAKLSSDGTYSAYGTPEAPALYFPSQLPWDGTADFGFVYCPGSSTPSDAGLYQVHQLADHWWVASQETRRP